MAEHHTVKFLSDGRRAQCAPNPAYPNGIEIDATQNGEAGCWVDLPYPAECVGKWYVECEACGGTTLITAAGRPDDPKRVKLPCKLPRSGELNG